MRTSPCFAFARQLTLSVLVFVLSVTVASAAPVKFNIPAQTAADALVTFSKQSGIDVLFSSKELKKAKSQAVIGEFEPDAAITLLLTDTGFSATRDGTKFVVKSAAPLATTGSVRGSLTGGGGVGLANVLVSIRETAQSAETDRYGVFIFPNVAAGTYVLVASAPGYRTMEIDGVNVKAGRDLTIGKEEMRKLGEGVLKLEPFVVHADTVEQLEKFEVTASREKPFAMNMDIPRSIDDIQPYYIFDSKTIERSGVSSVDDFLKQRLTMNTTYTSSSQLATSSTAGNVSRVNLRGLGTDSTLILINGRRTSGASLSGTSTNGNAQADINGIPLAAIDHIEVLPTSASGIYGGAALGGVVNVILKKTFTGAELRLTYKNTWGSDAPIRTASVTVGNSSADGKTRVFLSVNASDAKPLLVGDRRAVIDENIATLLRNSPSALIGSSTAPVPYLGSTVNITSFAVPLTLRGTTTSLGSNIATLPAGYSVSSSPTTIIGGHWNYDSPPTNQQPNGLYYPFTASPTTRGLTGNITRQLTSQVEVFADVSYSRNSSSLDYNAGRFAGAGTTLFVAATSPVNPFNERVSISVPITVHSPLNTRSENLNLTVGAKIDLPKQWKSELDYTWSRNRFSVVQSAYDTNALTADINAGTVNPFVDNLLYPFDAQKYVVPGYYRGSSSTDDFAWRATGDLLALPWGTPTAAFMLERQIARTPGGVSGFTYQVTTNFTSQTTFLKQSQIIDSAYTEVNLPLVAPRPTRPFLAGLDGQLAMRVDRYAVTSGTSSMTVSPNPTPSTSFSGPTLNGAPYSNETTYASSSPTVGLRWKLTPTLFLRASISKAFLPPTYSQLIPNPLPNTSQTTITDPRTNATYATSTISGGNPDLVPQNSKSRNIGLVWEPTVAALKGLRINFETYEIRQFDKIGTLSAQQIVNDSAYASRVTRDASTGLITLVNTSSLNLLEYETKGIDASVDYSREVPFGNISVHLGGTRILREIRQSSVTAPRLDYVGFVDANGGEVKDRGVATLVWSRSNWSAGWTARYTGSYNALRTSPNDPQYSGNPNATTIASFIALQGGTMIPSQTYHDIFLSYRFPNSKAQGGRRGFGTSLLTGVKIDLNVQNIFAKKPPFDEAAAPYYYSYYGDIRLRDYSITLTKQF